METILYTIGMAAFLAAMLAAGTGLLLAGAFCIYRLDGGTMGLRRYAAAMLRTWLRG